MPEFNHLHVHTQFSLLDGAAEISKLFKKAKNDGMRGLAITDHGNMFGVFNFVAEAQKYGRKVDAITPDGSIIKQWQYDIKPIVGCEFYLVDDRHRQSFTREEKDVRYHQLFLAKNERGYRNLSKLCSLGYLEGLYGKYPRIDKELILQYHEGLIATTCCLGAIVPRTILKKGEEEAEKEFKWWLDLFGEDYYIELQRHQIPEQDKVNEVLLKFAAKHGVTVIASNDSHYVDRADSNAHDILLCVNTGEKQSTPKAKDFSDEEGMPRGTRFAFYNDEFYFKTQQEMNHLFHDLPHATDNTGEIVDKIEPVDLKRDILLPNYPIPPEFAIHQGEGSDIMNQWEYLKHITFEGARKRYGEIAASTEERLNFELFTIKTMGFAGYFLIVADFIKAGRDLGVMIGPGRGSAAGSAVAYCIGITNIDPIKYDLLFERFLNPDRKSMPDIDTDFDDQGREKVINYVVEKYGREQVAQIITFGTMAARSSIKDVARVLDLPLNESNELAKMVPERPGITLKRVIHAPVRDSDCKEGEKSLMSKDGVTAEDVEGIKKLREIINGTDLKAKVLKEALILEGSVRNTGIHAAGIIIAPEPLTGILPMATAKDSPLLVTQFEGKIVEDAGVIKMDFLGLKNLSIIKDCLQLIRQKHGISIDIDGIPLDDAKTLELYQRGETVGTFQFESAGMQKYLKDLKPDKFEDLIAMNALYRPGPLQYIPNYIARKHGRETVTYDLPEMQEYLEETYGITVYQEQVMLLSQKLANFTKGEADTLRKAMGKKDRPTLDKLKPKFIEQATEKGLDVKILSKIWTDWEAFAQYAFNKSHATCYAFVAFQTMYLKAHYPAEYMAAVLNNAGNIEKISFFMEECKRMGISVLGPDVNESDKNFSVNRKGQIRFGLNFVKGVGESTVESLIEERESGAFTNIYDLTKRINQRAANRKSLESLALAGAFDTFPDANRAVFFHEEEHGKGTVLDKVLRFAGAYKNSLNNTAANLFGDSEDAGIIEPPLPNIPRWNQLYELSREKEVVGMFLSAHPLDNFRLDLEAFGNTNLAKLSELNLAENLEKVFLFGGIVTAGDHRISQKNGKPWGSFSIEDFSGTFSMRVFGEEYKNFRHLMEPDQFVFVTAKVVKGFQNREPEWKLVNMELLGNLRSKKAKTAIIHLNTDKINEITVTELFSTISAHPGNLPIRLKIYDNLQTGLKADAIIKNFRISLTDEALKAFRNLENIEFKIT
jgi:DNA polymerase-3 subunit alpha